VGILTQPSVVLFDFNGTISDDEPLLARIFIRMFEEIGIEVSDDVYFDEFAGYSDPEIVERMLHKYERWDDALAARLIARRSELYLEEIAITSPIRPEAARFVREVAARVPVAIASGAARAEIEAVLVGAGMREIFDVLVGAEDVECGKPDPEGYLLALELVNRRVADPIAAADALVFEDSLLGMQSAIAAGMRCVVVEGTAPVDRLGDADAVVSALDWSIPLIEGWNEHA
jgi:beta-phosphoglucomutase